MGPFFDLHMGCGVLLVFLILPVLPVLVLLVLFVVLLLLALFALFACLRGFRRRRPTSAPALVVGRWWTFRCTTITRRFRPLFRKCDLLLCLINLGLNWNQPTVFWFWLFLRTVRFRGRVWRMRCLWTRSRVRRCLRRRESRRPSAAGATLSARRWVRRIRRRCRCHRLLVRLRLRLRRRRRWRRGRSRRRRRRRRRGRGRGRRCGGAVLGVVVVEPFGLASHHQQEQCEGGEEHDDLKGHMVGVVEDRSSVSCCTLNDYSHLAGRL